MLEAVTLQKARRDRRAVAAGTVYEERPILRQFRQPFAEMIQRNVDAAADRLFRPLARRADVDKHRAARPMTFGRHRLDASVSISRETRVGRDASEAAFR